MALKESKKRASVDFTEENYKVIRDFSEKAGSSYGRVVNYLIDVFLKLTPEIRTELSTFCNEQLKKLMVAQLDCGGEYERQSIEKKIIKYRELSYFFGIGEQAKEDASSMRKMYLKNGYISFPADWIVINENDAANCSAAIVIEPTNKSNGLGHYLLFTDKKPEEMSAEEEDRVMDAIAVIDVEFRTAWNDSCKRLATYAERLMNLYPIYVKGDPAYDADYIPPYNCMIIPTQQRSANG